VSEWAFDTFVCFSIHHVYFMHISVRYSLLCEILLVVRHDIMLRCDISM